MIENPWPMEWTPPRLESEFRYEDPKRNRLFCHYSKMYNVLCTTKRAKCHHCYIRQLNITQINNTKFLPEEDRVVHRCDRCGRVIANIDTIVNLQPTNREGGPMFDSMELCFSCADELFAWVKGEKLPEEIEEFWSEPFEPHKPKPKKKKKKRKYTPVPPEKRKRGRPAKRSRKYMSNFLEKKTE